MRITPLRFITLQPPTLRRGEPGTTVWTDREGADVAFGATVGDWHWLRVSGAGSYRFPKLLAEPTISVEVVPENAPALVIDSFYRTVVPMALQAYGHEILHGSAVAIGGEVVAMCAEPETGKSTIAFALRRRGAVALADDAVVIGAGAGRHADRPLVQPLPFALRLREASAQHFDSPSKAVVLVGPEAAAQVSDEPQPLAAVLLLERGLQALGVTRLTSADAFSALLTQSYAFSLADGVRKREMMASFLKLARTVPVYRFAFPNGLEHLDAICEAIEDLVRLPSL